MMAWPPASESSVRQLDCAYERCSTSERQVTPVEVRAETLSKKAPRKSSKQPERYSGMAAKKPSNTHPKPHSKSERRRSRRPALSRQSSAPRRAVRPEEDT